MGMVAGSACCLRLLGSSGGGRGLPLPPHSREAGLQEILRTCGPEGDSYRWHLQHGRALAKWTPVPEVPPTLSPHTGGSGGVE